MIYKARQGYQVTVTGDNVELKGRGSVTSFNKNAISEVTIKKSPYDLPFVEKTVLIRLDNKKKYVIKRLPRSSAQELYNELNS